jgi:nucleoside-diphosphate-sugar epimerase
MTVPGITADQYEQKVNIGVIGALGFVGSAISRGFDQVSQHTVLPILRGDNVAEKISEVDYVIYSANPAKRFIANSNSEFDKKETIEKTAFFLKEARAKPFLLISSISCRTQLHTPYGINRKECEDIVLANGGAVVRLGPMYGTTRIHDVIHDICNNKKIYASKDSLQSFSSVEWNGAYIANEFLSFTGIVEIGSRNSISFSELADYAESSSEFFGDADDQFPLNFDSGPDVLNVLEFMDQIKLDQNRV